MPPVYGTSGYTLADILGRGPAPTTGFIDRGTAQSRYNRGLMTSGITPFLQSYLQQQFDPLYGAYSMMVPPQTDAASTAPGFVQSIRDYAGLGDYNPYPYTASGDIMGQGRTARGVVQREAGRLADLMGTSARGTTQISNPDYAKFLANNPGWAAMSDADKAESGLTPPPAEIDVQTGGTWTDPDNTGSSVFKPFEDADRLQFDRYMDNPMEQYRAARTGASFGVHPLFRGGTQSALRRLFESMGGEEMGTPFLSAAKAAGYF